MLHDITLDEFGLLTLNEKHEAIGEYATFIADRIVNEFGVLLYKFENFYAEVYYDAENNVIKKITSFDTDLPLTPYLSQIDLSELTEG